MEKCTQQASRGGLEQTTMSVANPFIPPTELSTLYTVLQDVLSPSDAIALRDSSVVGPPVESKSEYYSVRVEEMMRTSSQFPSPIEHAIAHSKAHWSEVTGPSNPSETSESGNNSYISYIEEVDRENEEVFAELMNNREWRWGDRPFFWKAGANDFKLGRKIAEGGQAEIFEVIFPPNKVKHDTVLKVFKKGLHLSKLKSQWPSAILRGEFRACIANLGLMLEDGRFGFLMLRCTCDLRTLIDKAMLEKKNQGPPFPCDWKEFTLTTQYFMKEIADHMTQLHEKGVLHRDLKAANILIFEHQSTFPHQSTFRPVVADFECSLEVVGTGFFRAPEVLLALRERRAVEFSQAMDVYSYGMICFELVTGRLPFEGELEHCRASFDLVIAGQRPKLPSDLDLTLKDLIESCWHPIPGRRPSFPRIVEILDS